MTPTLRAALGALALLLTTAGCTRDYCAVAPACEGNTAINCVRACDVGPCSTGSKVRDCSEGTQCLVASGNAQSDRFFFDRAVCAVKETGVCDPDITPAPTCDSKGNVTGCSAYHRVIEAPCTQAALYFANAKCCTELPGDGGSDGGADGGQPDGGLADAGP